MSSEAFNTILEWATTHTGLTAPYGVLPGKTTNRNGKKYLSITFGVARVSDVEVCVYSDKFIYVRDSRYGNVKYDTVEATLEALNGHYPRANENDLDMLSLRG